MNKQQVLRSGLMSLVFLAGPILNGCANLQPQDLSFETISQGVGFPTGRSYDGKEPNFLVITEPREVDDPGLGVQFTSELVEQLRGVDYRRSFAIVVFRGLLSALNREYTVDIFQITRLGDKVVLKVHLGVPRPGSITSPAYSSPYRAIVVSKEGEWAREISFVLEVDGQAVIERTYFVP
ncbi:MAG TPA: hypothetical protein VIK33_13230 [Anaerolineae bacterium]